MRLYEIPDYLNKKVRRKIHDDGFYIIFKNGVWICPTINNIFYYLEKQHEDNDWEEYTEAKEVKRYWKWIATTPDGSVVECSEYLDANAISAGGATYFTGVVKKWKISSIWVDVDSDGNIVDCSESLE